MKFVLIDKVISLESGKSIKTVKNVSLAEEYLQDHFPIFPVLPGVLLLEGLVESASWLIREYQKFQHSMVLLKETRNVKYRTFLAPGAQVEYKVDCGQISDDNSKFKGAGFSNGELIMQAKFELRHFNLADENPGLAEVDKEIIKNMKQRWRLLKRCR